MSLSNAQRGKRLGRCLARLRERSSLGGGAVKRHTRQGHLVEHDLPELASAARRQGIPIVRVRHCRMRPR